jgi:hypothetical protein
VARVYTTGANTDNLHPWQIPDGVIQGQQTAWDLSATPDRLYGGFGSGPNYLAAFHLDKVNVDQQAWRFGTVGNVEAVALTPDRSRLFFGGHFGINPLNQTVCSGKSLRGLASVDPANGAIYCDFIPSLDQEKRPSYDGAWALTTTDSYLWVDGGFIGVSDSIDLEVTEVPQTNLARFTL